MYVNMKKNIYRKYKKKKIRLNTVNKPDIFRILCYFKREFIQHLNCTTHHPGTHEVNSLLLDSLLLYIFKWNKFVGTS